MRWPSAPDPGWIPFLKLGFGFTLLFIFGMLARGIGLNQVEAHTSFGLDIILGGLISLSGAFGSWAFREGSERLSNSAPNPEGPHGPSLT